MKIDIIEKSIDSAVFHTKINNCGESWMLGPIDKHQISKVIVKDGYIYKIDMQMEGGDFIKKPMVEIPQNDIKTWSKFFLENVLF